MSFSEAVRSVYRNWSNFSGRAPRSEYWWFQLFFLLVLLGWFFAVALIGRSPANAVLALVVLAFFVMTIIPALAVSVRRMHDWGHSGWWLLIGLVPYIGGLITLIFMVMPSSYGYNAWGAPYGQPPVAHRGRYWGYGRADIWQKFLADSQQAQAHGYQPVWQQWRVDSGAEVLEVDYAWRAPEPPWHFPGPAAPWAPPPAAYPPAFTSEVPPPGAG